MSSPNDPRLLVVQLNAELRTAQLDLLSAQCATDRLRLRFSTEDLARYGHHDLLHKAASSASALHEFYSAIERIIQSVESAAAEGDDAEARLRKAVTLVSTYLREQREHYLGHSKPLSEPHRALMAPFFSPNLLAKIRIVELPGARMADPPFYSEAKATGFDNLPDFARMPSLTFEDVLVFQDSITPRSLFHALAHAVQFAVLGLENYTQLFVQAFFRTRSHVRVPLEAHVLSLESKFVEDPRKSFSVEEQVRLWINQRRYESPQEVASGR